MLSTMPVKQSESRSSAAGAPRSSQSAAPMPMLWNWPSSGSMATCGAAMDVAENRAPEWFENPYGLWQSSFASAWILEQLAWTIRGASLPGSTRANKRKHGLRRVTIESPVPSIGHDRCDHSQHRGTGSLSRRLPRHTRRKIIDELLFEILGSDARSRRIVTRMRDNAIDRWFVTVQSDPASFSGAAR